MGDRDILHKFSLQERAFAERLGRGDDARSVWTSGPLNGPSESHFLCHECEGNKCCTEAPHPYCNGWCEYCGGAGQLPIHPAEPVPLPPPSECPYPRPMLFNLDYIRLQYIRRCLAADPS